MILILTSRNGGLAHYAIHLSRSVSKLRAVSTLCSTTGPVDETARKYIGKTAEVIDPHNRSTIDDVLSYSRKHQVRIVDIHVGTTVKRHSLYYTDLLTILKQDGNKILMHLHDASIHSSGDANSRALSQLLPLADHIFAGSHNEAQVAKTFSDKRRQSLSLMQHGPFYLFASEPQVGLPSFQETQNLSRSRLFLFFGGLKREKGLETLYHAYLHILSQGFSAQLTVSTHTGYSSEDDVVLLEKLASLPGVAVSTEYVCSDRLNDLFRTADIVVLPYHRVAHSGVYNLARAFLKPVIITDAFTEHSKIDGVCGFVAKANNPLSLANAMMQSMALSSTQCSDYGDKWKHIFLEPEDEWNNIASNFLYYCNC